MNKKNVETVVENENSNGNRVVNGAKSFGNRTMKIIKKSPRAVWETTVTVAKSRELKVVAATIAAEVVIGVVLVGMQRVVSPPEYAGMSVFTAIRKGGLNSPTPITF